jgi:hypothetical protein
MIHFQRGQAMLEILIVLLILIPLIFGGLELTRGVAVRSSLDSGVTVAVQALSLDSTQWDWAAIEVASAVSQNFFGDVGVGTVHFEAYDSTNAPLDKSGLAGLSYGAPFCIVGWVNYTAVIPLIDLSGVSPIKISVRHCGVVQNIV